jgi:GNAT superfamily N-acetyltransferase
VRFRDVMADEGSAVLELVMDSFNKYVGPDYSAEGVAEFTAAARGFVFDRPADHAITVADDEGTVVGMIDVRDCWHVCLFFVDPARMGEGVGRGLLAHAVARCAGEPGGARELTVNSSPWAVPAYRSFGFEATGPESERNGIRSVPMVKRL